MKHVRERSNTASGYLCGSNHSISGGGGGVGTDSWGSLPPQRVASGLQSPPPQRTPPAGGRGAGNRHIEPIFHPQLRRTKEVIRRPEWVRRAGEAVAHRGSLNTVAVFGIMFANCVGGGYGFEDGIGAAGPLITLIVCIILPWLWAFPTGLAVAELSTSVPSNSGVLMWTNAAFPPFVSVMCILATIFITFIGNATYPNLTAEYAENLGHLSAAETAAVKVGVVAICCILNCVGVEIVGSSSIILCCITILPFSLLTLIQLFGHGFNKAVLYVDLKEVNWANFFSIISWNYANIENAGAVVEEVANPRKALPKAMMLLMFSTYVAYVMPMLAGVSAEGVGQDYSKWEAGHWPEVAKTIGGDWLKYMLFSGALLSGVGFTLTSMCCTSRLLAGMGTMEMFPKRLSRFIGYYHPRLGTPIPAVVLNAVVTLVFSVSLDFTNVVALCQSIYCLRMILIYAAVVKLRLEYPNLPRPYALPCNNWIAALCLAPAAAFSLMASIVSAMTTLAIGMALVGFIVVGSALSYAYCRVFAPNGFQGVIVQCEVSDDGGSDDDVDGNGGDGDGNGGNGGDGGGGGSGEEGGALNEGIFYHDDGESDAPGEDLLLGILPVSPAPVAVPQRQMTAAAATGDVEMTGVEYDMREINTAAVEMGGFVSPHASLGHSANLSTLRHRHRHRSPAHQMRGIGSTAVSDDDGDDDDFTGGGRAGDISSGSYAPIPRSSDYVTMSGSSPQDPATSTPVALLSASPIVAPSDILLRATPAPSLPASKEAATPLNR